jgi:hypothetical protein
MFEGNKGHLPQQGWQVARISLKNIVDRIRMMNLVGTEVQRSLVP